MIPERLTFREIHLLVSIFLLWGFRLELCGNRNLLGQLLKIQVKIRNYPLWSYKFSCSINCTEQQIGAPNVILSKTKYCSPEFWFAAHGSSPSTGRKADWPNSSDFQCCRTKLQALFLICTLHWKSALLDFTESVQIVSPGNVAPSVHQHVVPVHQVVSTGVHQRTDTASAYLTIQSGHGFLSVDLDDERRVLQFALLDRNWVILIENGALQIALVEARLPSGQDLLIWHHSGPNKQFLCERFGHFFKFSKIHWNNLVEELICGSMFNWYNKQFRQYKHETHHQSNTNCAQPRCQFSMPPGPTCSTEIVPAFLSASTPERIHVHWPLAILPCSCLRHLFFKLAIFLKRVNSEAHSSTDEVISRIPVSATEINSSLQFVQRIRSVFSVHGLAGLNSATMRSKHKKIIFDSGWSNIWDLSPCFPEEHLSTSPPFCFASTDCQCQKLWRALSRFPFSSRWSRIRTLSSRCQRHPPNCRSQKNWSWTCQKSKMAQQWPDCMVAGFAESPKHVLLLLT